MPDFHNAVGRVMGVLVIAGLLALVASIATAVSYRDQAQAWECNAARQKQESFALAQMLVMARGSSHPAKDATVFLKKWHSAPHDADVLIRLRKPRPDVGYCWPEGNGRRTEGAPQHKVVF